MALHVPWRHMPIRHHVRLSIHRPLIQRETPRRLAITNQVARIRICGALLILSNLGGLDGVAKGCFPCMSRAASTA